MKIAVASPPYPKSIEDGLYWIDKLSRDAADQQAVVVCFPETYLPGYPGFGAEKATPQYMQAALERVCEIAAKHSVCIIIPMDWFKDGELLNVAYVISNTGDTLGYQTKNQLDPSEDNIWTAGTERSLFEIDGLKFGITICHEGFRYPESVRWAARNGAQVVFHPHFTGSDTEGVQLNEWGEKHSPYYEKAMMMRAMENTIYFVSVGYATKYQEAASCIVAPDGVCLAHQPYGEAGVAVVDIDLGKATGLLAKRFKPKLVREV
ncbi:carbon-nitrogen hydrolase family protein [Mucilaginibacter gilvus]|uniref:Carbon-nitrogen hydrolase family protein n=1 Tax=Mucilaginibacter gilvus TaxID=2305909 RepID=A0A444MN51_9SPHI|nr:carbon-nitrogen hydrolase family protein [Mucilaginibacter gilvus]RWY51142.1 carbon-nitrogen hydrolase family protein [Mucilaginibacter gilvus]